MTGSASKSWTLIHHRELGIIEVRYQGDVTAEEMLEGSVARMELGVKEGVSDFLLDGSDCTAGEATAEIIYDIVTREYPARGIDPNSRFAFLPPTSPEALWLGGFFESMCEQHDLTIRRFPDRDSAMDWLTSAGTRSADTEK